MRDLVLKTMEPELHPPSRSRAFITFCLSLCSRQPQDPVMQTNEQQQRIERLRVAKEALHMAAARVSEELGGAPVVVVVGGSSAHGLEATLAGWANLADGREGRFRDVVGILQSAVQIESFLHYMEDDVFQDLKDKVSERSWWSKGRRAGAGNPPSA